MYREIPVGNRLLSKKWEKDNNKKHLEKLKKARPTIDMLCPPSFPKKRSETWRKGSPQAERRLRIRHDNRMLVDKLEAIKNKRSQTESPSQIVSRNYAIREKRANEIKKQNEALSKRITEKQPMYNIRAWEDERKANEKLLKVICQFPYQLGTAHRKHRKVASETPTKFFRSQAQTPAQTLS